MPGSFWVAVPVAVPVAFWVAIRTATPTRAENPRTAPVSRVPFSSRQGSGSSNDQRQALCVGSLKAAPQVPRPFWVVFWDPFWDPFWRPIRTGSPSVAQTPCIAPASTVSFSTRQPSGLRECSERGTVPMSGASGERRLARAVDRWSHARPANRADAGEEVWR